MHNRLVALAMSLLGLVGMLALAASADAGGRPLSTTLTGAEEAPSPGDANAAGQADLTLNQGQEEICFDLGWENVDGEVFAAHIHVGPPGEAGPIVVLLFEGSFAGTDSVSGCVDVEKDLVKTIRKNAEDYYVNVHSRPNFPGGAIRGQLGD
jgi:CHRD domain